MKLGLIGKFPPIVGGVSSKAFWLYKGLADRGYEVHVITNSYEVEHCYREQIVFNDIDEHLKNPNLKIHSTSPASTPAYIPQSNPYEIKLASLALDVVGRYDIDILDCWYFVPYGVAGYLVNTITGIPWSVRHAGSDMGRLLPNHLFGPLLKNVLHRATKVVTNNTHTEPMLKLGIEASRLWVSSLISVNTDYFKPKGEKARELPKDKPVILSMGKLAEVKGTYDLLRSFEPIKNDAYLVYLTGGPDTERLSHEIKLMNMEDDVIIIPPIPPWRVPEFFRGSCCVVLAERDFPIIRHTPILPREILACGKCLVVSGEIYQKYNFLKDEVNCLMFNPHDHKQFSDVLKKVISDNSMRERIEQEAFLTSNSIEKFNEYLDENINFLEELKKGN